MSVRKYFVKSSEVIPTSNTRCIYCVCIYYILCFTTKLSAFSQLADIGLGMPLNLGVIYYFIAMGQRQQAISGGTSHIQTVELGNTVMKW